MVKEDFFMIRTEKEVYECHTKEQRNMEGRNEEEKNVNMRVIMERGTPHPLFHSIFSDFIPSFT